jgi:uncharacterized protein
MADAEPINREKKPIITLVEETKSSETNPTIVLGLPDTGLVGIIAAGHLIESLKMTEIGYIDSDRFPPVVILHKGLIKNPFRIYQGDGMILIISEIPTQPRLVNDLSRAIVDYSQAKNAKLIIALGGVPIPNRTSIATPEVFAVKLGGRASDMVKKAEIKPLEEGILVGPYASVLWQCKKRNIQVISLLAQSFPDYPDPGAAAAVVESLSKIIGKKIDTKALMESAEEIRVKTRDLMKQTGRTMQEMGKAREYEIPPLYM